MQQNLTRREALKRGAMTAGALAWATPVMQVVGISPAYAQETSPGDRKDCCIDEAGNTIKLARLEMKYLGGTSSCVDGPSYPYIQDPSLVSCTDYVTNGSLPDEVYIVASHQEFPFDSEGNFKPSARIWYPGPPPPLPRGDGHVIKGTTFWIDAGNALETRLKGETWVHIFRPTDTGGKPPYTEEYYVQKVGFHTSCSEPLFTGDIFGAVELIDCAPEDAEATTLEPAAETQELEGTEELDGTETTQTTDTTEASEGSETEGEAETPGRPGTGQGTVPETPAEPPGEAGAPGDDSGSDETDTP